MTKLGVLLFLIGARCHGQLAQDIHARLETPVSSYSKPGQSVEIRIGPPVEFGAAAILAPGTILRGRVREAHGIGIGIRRERASLSLDFDNCSLAGHPSATCAAQLIEIENARETVGDNNSIRGILAASNPNSLLQGIWFRPAGAFFHRSPAGLTGPVGALQSRLAPHPLGAAITVAGRLILFSLPNSEIELPAGAEIILRIAAQDSPGHAILPLSPSRPDAVELSAEELRTLRELPVEIRSAQGAVVADRVNFAFLGSEQQLEQAFAAAGWTTADPLTRKSFTRSYSAFAALRCYAKAPVSPLLYQKRLPELVFQKSFNSMAKRHHIRLWRTSLNGREAWLGAATHDIGIAFDWSRMSLTHRVDPLIDHERSKVLNDLDTARCLRRLSLVDRPALAGGATDGGLAVAEFMRCDAPPASARWTIKRPSHSVPVRVARRVVLEARQYITRGNAYYWAYRGVRLAVAGIRPPPAAPGAAIPVANGLRF